MTAEHRYSRVEYERRFLVVRESGWRSRGALHRCAITDLYLHDSRLRVRAIEDLTTDERTLKLTKKDPSTSAYFRTISRILLSEAEYELLASLDGDRLTKVRHHVEDDGRRWAIDVFGGALDGLVLCEIEAESLEDLLALEGPAWVERDVTDDQFFEGANLARTSHGELLAKLATFRAS